MTQDDIKEALETCILGYCTGCPYDGCDGDCRDELHKDILNLINEQETEIEQLKAENEKMRKERGYINQLKEELLLKHYHVDCYQEEIKKQAKIDVLNELKEKCKFDGHTVAVYKNDIDKFIKEIEKCGESGGHDRHFTPNDDTLEIILVKDLQEVEK